MTVYPALPLTTYIAAAHNSTEFSIDGDRGANIWVDITNANGGSVIVKLQHKSPSGTWLDVTGVVTASLSSATATNVKVYPGIAVVANASLNVVLGGGVYRIVATVSTATMTLRVTVQSIT